MRLLRLGVVLTVLIASVIWSNCFGQNNTNTTFDTKILSYNIYMLPGFGSGQGKRARAIAKYILEQDYDLVLFQEAWVKRQRRRAYE